MKVPSLIGMRGRESRPFFLVINRAAHSVNGSTCWGFLGAEINAVAYGAGAVQIKALSAVPGSEEAWDHTVHTGLKEAASSAHLEAAVLKNSPKEWVPCSSACCSAHSFLLQHRRRKHKHFPFQGHWPLQDSDKGTSASVTNWTASVSGMVLEYFVIKIRVISLTKWKPVYLMGANDKDKLNQDFVLSNYLNTKNKPRNDLRLGSFKMLLGIFY